MTVLKVVDVGGKHLLRSLVNIADADTNVGKVDLRLHDPPKILRQLVHGEVVCLSDLLVKLELVVSTLMMVSVLKPNRTMAKFRDMHSLAGGCVW